MEKQIIKFQTRPQAEDFRSKLRSIAPAAFAQVCLMKRKYCAIVTNATQEQIQMALGRRK